MIGTLLHHLLVGQGCEKVDKLLAIARDAADNTTGGSRSCGSGQARRLVDEEFDGEGSEYDPSASA